MKSDFKKFGLIITFRIVFAWFFFALHELVGCVAPTALILVVRKELSPGLHHALVVSEGVFIVGLL